ncbi:hypothetical protein [Halalkalibacter alkalisediminis]|uniref:Uncharacterized protein n=1 Tax=Halalkalibacter alkalisediminis TaxID=935616 RepID=A0ABV6NP46_9BACI|nr:hypothetical protein [Halalkalibacter alkalisediminis]
MNVTKVIVLAGGLIIGAASLRGYSPDQVADSENREKVQAKRKIDQAQLMKKPWRGNRFAV